MLARRCHRVACAAVSRQLPTTTVCRQAFRALSADALRREPWNVVVGLDGSDSAQIALDTALGVIRPNDKLHLVYVPPVLGM